MTQFIGKVESRMFLEEVLMEEIKEQNEELNINE